MLILFSFLYPLIILVIRCANNYYDAFKEMTTDFHFLSYDLDSDKYHVLISGKKEEKTMVKFYTDQYSSVKHHR